MNLPWNTISISKEMPHFKKPNANHELYGFAHSFLSFYLSKELIFVSKTFHQKSIVKNFTFFFLLTHKIWMVLRSFYHPVLIFMILSLYNRRFSFLSTIKRHKIHGRHSHGQKKNKTSTTRRTKNRQWS